MISPNHKNSPFFPYYDLLNEEFNELFDDEIKSNQSIVVHYQLSTSDGNTQNQ